MLGRVGRAFSDVLSRLTIVLIVYDLVDWSMFCSTVAHVVDNVADFQFAVITIILGYIPISHFLIRMATPKGTHLRRPQSS